MNINMLIFAAAGFALACLILGPPLVLVRRRAAKSEPTGRHALRVSGGSAKRGPANEPEGKAPHAAGTEPSATPAAGSDTKAPPSVIKASATKASATKASATEVAATEVAVPAQQTGHAEPDSAGDASTSGGAEQGAATDAGSFSTAGEQSAERSAAQGGEAAATGTAGAAGGDRTGEAGEQGETDQGPAQPGDQPDGGVSVRVLPTALFERNYQAKFRRTHDRIQRLREQLNERN